MRARRLACVLLVALAPGESPARADAAAGGCLTAVAIRGCTFDPALDRPKAVAFSPDGRHVYTAGAPGAVLAFRFQRGLVRIAGPTGCLSTRSVPDCGVLRGVLDPESLTF